MADLAAMNIKVGADISGLEKGSISAQKELGKMAIAANKLDSSLAKSVKGTNQAAFALQGLGRVAQDAPFGFIGIQNNINPLLESFQRLKAETGSTSLALKALGSSLLGAGGIGLAVSVVTGLLTVLSQNGFFKTEKAAKAGTSANEAYAKSLKEVIGSIAGEATKIGSLVATLERETLTRKEKINAVNELKRLNPSYFGELDAEKSKIGEITSAYKLYAQSLIGSIKARLGEKQLTETVSERLRLQAELNKLSINGARQLGNEAEKQFRETGIFALQVGDQIQRQVGRAVVKIDQREASDRVNRLIKLLNAEIQLTNEAASNFRILNTEIDKPLKEEKFKTFADIMKELRKELATLENSFESGILSPKAFRTDNLEAYQKALKGLFDLGAGLGQKDVKQIKVEMKPFIAPNAIDAKEVFVAIDTAQKMAPKLPINLDIKGVDPALIKPALSPIQQAVLDITTQMGEDIAIAVGDGLGKALAGENPGDIFKSIFSIIGEGLQTLGKTLIKTSGLIAGFKKAFASLGPAGMLAAGVGLVAVGALIKSSIPKFDKGVENFGGGLAYVHKGEVLMNLAKGTTVIPKNQVGAIGGGGGGEVTTQRIEIAGDKLYLVLERYKKARGRAT